MSGVSKTFQMQHIYPSPLEVTKVDPAELEQQRREIIHKRRDHLRKALTSRINSGMYADLGQALDDYVEAVIDVKLLDR